MDRLFIEAKPFSKELANIGQEGLLQEIQILILKNPAAGDLVQGTGGIRKIRVSNPSRGKGKRGGYRVLYLDLEDRKHTHLLLIFSKGDVSDITSEERSYLNLLSKQIKARKRLKT